MHDLLAQLPGYALRRATNAMMADLSARLQKIGLRLSEASVLLLIDGRTDVTSSDLGRVLDIQRANMVPLLGRLDAAGLIVRKQLDRKSSAIILTDEGTARLALAKAITESFEAELMARIPEQHRDHLVPALNALWM
ncbi:MAG: MarR family transcriptional regulator [Novosphingobium sp.]